MAHTNTTTHYSLPIFIASDKPGWLSDWNKAMNDIDAAIYEASQTGSGESETAKEALAKATQALTEAQTAAASAASALSTATSAESTANSANSKATKNATDISEINDTISTMQTALSTAQNNIITLQQNYVAVDSKATTASTNANTALTKATSAETIANQAKTTAQTANSTAEDAQTTANSAQTGVNNLQSKVSSLESQIIEQYVFAFDYEDTNNIFNPGSCVLYHYTVTGEEHLLFTFTISGVLKDPNMSFGNFIIASNQVPNFNLSQNTYRIVFIHLDGFTSGSIQLRFNGGGYQFQLISPSSISSAMTVIGISSLHLVKNPSGNWILAS